MPNVYNNNIQIVQNQDYVVILSEMVHDARIIPCIAAPGYPMTSVCGPATPAVVGRAAHSSSRPVTSTA